MWKISIAVLIVTLSCAVEVTKPSGKSNTNLKQEVNEVISSADTSKEIGDTLRYDYDFTMALGLFDPAEHPDYVLIDKKYADREGLYLHKDTYTAFIKMFEAATDDGVNLLIRSATRNFEYQKGIWERKWTGETKVRGQDLSSTHRDPKSRALKILEYSSMPGTSRHHWGSDIDLNNFNNTWFESGEGKILFDWLEANASSFDFCRPYTAKDLERPNGYQEERWHWSYMPLSKYFMDIASKEHSDEKINGFMGSEVAAEIEVVSKYVFGVSKECFEK